MSENNAVMDTVIECVSICLDMDREAISSGDKLIDDLGADSLDMLDLIFQLEQRFAIRITPGDMEKRLAAELAPKPMEIDGLYTPEALEELRKAMPEVPEEELSPGLQQGQLPRLFRVQTMANLVSRLIEEQRAVRAAAEGDQNE